MVSDTFAVAVQQYIDWLICFLILFSAAAMTHWLKRYLWPRVGPGYPFSLLFSLVHSLHRLLHFFTISFFLFSFALPIFFFLSIPSLSTRIIPLRFQAGSHRRRPNLGLVCLLYDCVICIA